MDVAAHSPIPEMPPVDLYQESFAPWCEKARWALDHHGIHYRRIEHLPLLGEPALRWAARRGRGRVTVPLLVTRDARLCDSLSIAQWADRVGAGEPLFPPAVTSEVDAWNRRSEMLMEAGRALLLPRLLANDRALREQLPPFVPRALRATMQPVAAMAARHLMRKYGIVADRVGVLEDTVRDGLRAVRAALVRDGRHLVAGRFTYADVAMATALQFIVPVSDAYMPLGPATRVAWTHPELARGSADLIAWRDRLYTERRRPAAAHAA